MGRGRGSAPNQPVGQSTPVTDVSIQDEKQEYQTFSKIQHYKSGIIFNLTGDKIKPAQLHL